MIERTFLYLPSVSRARERRLWEAGIESWRDLRNAIAHGRTIRELVRRDGCRQRTFSFSAVQSGPLSLLDESASALKEKRYQFFLEHLRPSDHWRVLDAALKDALYLDIETTGLSLDINYCTVIGAMYRGKFYQWVWPEPLDEFARLLREAPLVVTFNGKRFDLPFLRHHAPSLPAPRAHLDLLPIVRAAELRGSQKEVELKLGLNRGEKFKGYDGAEAVIAWCRSVYGDERSFRKLLAYNRADVEMMPRIAAAVYRQLAGRELGSVPKATRTGKKPMPFDGVQAAWHERRPHLVALEATLLSRFQRHPVVVGVDLRAKAANPTGFAICQGAETETRILYNDEEILRETLAAKPDLVSIDAPLFLPRGRTCVSDDSPCRAIGGIVRDAERILWKRRIRVYPALLRQMQGLTQRGIELAAKLRAEGIEVIESYPGAAQDLLNIPRKKADLSLLGKGLTQFGYNIVGDPSHDELDAITSALVGQFYLAGREFYEELGAPDEGYMIVPRWGTMIWQDELPCNLPSAQLCSC